MESSRWAEQEFGSAELGDERRTRRLKQLGTAMAEHASSSLSEVCEDWAEQKAGYRSFSNAGVRPEAILASHRAATKEAHGFTTLSLRGLARAAGEYLLACLAHNLGKLLPVCPLPAARLTTAAV